jgi:uncharacterized protein (TIRG00374 family)
MISNITLRMVSYLCLLMAAKPETNSSFSINWNKLIRRISIIVGIGFLVNIIIIAFWSESFNPKIIFRFHPAFLLLAFMVGILPIFLHAYTLKLWGDYFQKKLTHRDSIQVSATSLLGAAVTPTMFGGGPLKLGLLMVKGFRAGQAAAVVTMGSIQDAIAFIILLFVSIYISDSVGLDILSNKLNQIHFSPELLMIIALSILSIAFLSWLFAEKTAVGQKIVHVVQKSLHDFKDSYKLVMKHGKNYFLATTLINLFRWITIYLILVILIAGLRIGEIDYWEIISLEWIVFSGMTFTPLPGGAGGAEAAFYLVYKSFFKPDLIAVLILVWRFFEAYFRLIFAALLVVFLSKSSK